MMTTETWTPGEMLAVAASKFVEPRDTVVVGLGLPQVAAALAQRTRARDARLLLELGVFEPRPVESAMGIADPRMWNDATAFGGVLDVLGYMLHGGRVNLGILGSLQVDPTGAVNTTMVTDEHGTPRRFNGSGGGNDIASLAERIVVLVRHQPRKFAEAVEFMTSPGRRVDGVGRDELGLPGGGTTAIVTDRAVIEIGPDGAALASVHPGETVDAVLADTPMPINVADPGVTDAPTNEELHLIRTELDPNSLYTR